MYFSVIVIHIFILLSVLRNLHIFMLLSVPRNLIVKINLIVIKILYSFNDN